MTQRALQPALPITRTPEDFIAHLKNVGEHAVLDLFADRSMDERAEVALSCYRKTHLQELALALAATCDRATLVQVGGYAGEVLFEAVRNRAHHRHPSIRRPVSLSQTVLRTFPPLEDEAEAIEA